MVREGELGAYVFPSAPVRLLLPITAAEFAPELPPNSRRRRENPAFRTGPHLKESPKPPMDGRFSLPPGCWSRNRTWAIRIWLLLTGGRSDVSLVQVFGDARLICLSARPHVERDTYDDFRAEGYPYDQKDYHPHFPCSVTDPLPVRLQYRTTRLRVNRTMSISEAVGESVLLSSAFSSVPQL